MNLKFDLESPKIEKIKINKIPFNEKTIELKEELLNKLPKDFINVINNIKKKSQLKCPILKNESSGAFGMIEYDKKNNQIKKLIDLIDSKKLNILNREYNLKKINKKEKNSSIFFIINRLDNFCKDMNIFIKNVKNLFPEHFLNIKKCNLCKNNKNDISSIYLEMDLASGFTLYDGINKKILNLNELKNINIILQYIFYTLNYKKIYHNDLKPKNIIISKTNKKIKYDFLKNNKYKIILEIPKDTYIPIIIDYDFTTTEKPFILESTNIVYEGSSDISFYINSLTKYDIFKNTYLNTIPQFKNRIEIINEINIIKIFKSMSMNISNNIIVKLLKK